MANVTLDEAVINLIATSNSNKHKDLLNKYWDYDMGVSDKSLPFIDFVLEDKSMYPQISEFDNPRTKRKFVDEDNDFLRGNSGGLILKMDFIFVDTWKFTIAADHYRKYKKYTLHSKGSLEYRKFWALETQRRRIGLTRKCKVYYKDVEEYFNPETTEDRKKELTHDVHITGDFYTYLNYGRIERTPDENERVELDAKGLFSVETIEDFPRFWDGDYWGYKVLRFAELNKYNNCIAKARRKGWSYKNSNSSANIINLVKNITVHHIADILDYLTEKGGLSYMTKINLDWFETKTDWKRGFVSQDYSKGITTGYKKTKTGNTTYGFLSTLLSDAAGKNTSVAIGKKAYKIKVEEAGKFAKILEFLNVTTSNMESGAMIVGSLDIWGTGGTKGANWESFRYIYYNTSAYNILPFENVWDKNKRHTTCGYFHPQVLNYEPYIWDGNSLLFSSHQFDKTEKDSAKAAKSTSDYIIHCAQRANSPEEAFINTTTNLFESPELNLHIANLQIDDSATGYTDGWYVRTSNGIEFFDRHKCIEERVFGNSKFHEFILDVPHTNKTDVHGCVREYDVPYRDEYGNIPKDLYFAVVDPYGVNKLQKEVTDKHSLYSIQVYMRSNSISNNPGKCLVAEYTGRLDSMQDNDMVLWNMLVRWNAKALVESNRGNTIDNFKAWKLQHLLLYDPTEVITNIANPNIQYKVLGMSISTSDSKLEGLTMLKDYIYEITGYDENQAKMYRLYKIKSIPFLLELQRFNDTGNFDRISTAILAQFEFKKDTLLKKNALFKNADTKKIKLSSKLKRT